LRFRISQTMGSALSNRKNTQIQPESRKHQSRRIIQCRVPTCSGRSLRYLPQPAWGGRRRCAERDRHRVRPVRRVRERRECGARQLPHHPSVASGRGARARTRTSSGASGRRNWRASRPPPGRHGTRSGLSTRTSPFPWSGSGCCCLNRASTSAAPHFVRGTAPAGG